MTIRTRLSVTAVLCAAIVCVVGAVGLVAERNVRAAWLRIETESLPLIDALHAMRFAALRVVSSTSEYALVQTERRRTTGDATAAPRVPDTDEVGLRDAAAVAFSTSLSALESLLARVQPERRDLVTGIDLEGQELLTASQRVVDATNRGAPPAELLDEKARLEVAEQKLLKTLADAVADHADTVPRQSAGARATMTRLLRLGALALGLAAALVLLVIVGAGRTISASLDELNRAAEAVGQGTLETEIEVTSDDEIGRLAKTFNRMASDLRRTTVSRSTVDNIVRSIPDGLLVTDARLVITRANPAALRLLNATDPQQVLGRRLTEVSVDVAGPAQRVTSIQMSTSFETTLVPRTGAPVPVSLSLSPLKGSGDQKHGLLCLAQDVRERREAERLLVEARDRAQAADRAKSEFLAMMSHELRTPLNAIIGYSEMLQETAGDGAAAGPPDGVADLRKIEKAGRQLLSIVDRVLELANAESGKTALTLEPFPLAALIEEVRSETEPVAGRRGNTFRVTVTSDVGTMVADRVKLRQVLTNLLGNACKFTERGSVTLTVRRVDANGLPSVAFEVNDSGIGMSAEQMHTLFTPFAQADSSASRKYGGTGLGLALASRFCRMMSGTIDVSSAPGRGSCFTVTLPLDVPSRDLAA